MTAVMLVFVVPLIGLSVDAGILYAVQAKLSMAVDAGALAGARALSRGLDDATQQANAKSIAQEYVAMNFPNNYFGAPSPTVPTPTVDESVSNQRSVTVTATVAVPLYFMRWLSYSTTTVAAAATATRRDVNVVIVMDRSGSLAQSGSCAPLQSAATNFVNRFANGRDNVGLVTFATSTYSGPDFPIANNFLSATNNVPKILSELTCTGATNSAQGLWQGYSQLVSLNQPNALNVLLFFTDGYPTAMTATFPILSSSTCSDKTSKTAVLTAAFNAGDLVHPVVNYGLLSQFGSAQPMTSDIVTGPTSPANAYSNCAYASDPTTVARDVKYIPASDIFGNAMNTNYQAVTYYDGNGNIQVSPTSIVNASVNAADSAALRIRHGASVTAVSPTIPTGGSGIPSVNIFCIGLGNAGGVPDDFLERVANDARASNYDSTYPAGIYIYAPTSADLGDAFSRIAAEILHISK